MSEARQRHRVGRACDLPPGRHTVVRAGNRELGIFNIGGTLHALPNLCSLNFVVHGLLGDGVAASTRSDAQAKSLGEFLRARLVDIPRSLLAE